MSVFSLLLLLPVALPAQDPPPEVEEEVVVEEEVLEEEIVEEEVIEEEVAAEPEPDPLTPEQAAEMLKIAFKSKELDLIFVAIEAAGLVADKSVVQRLAPGLKHKDPEVRLETIQALRFNTDPEALKELIKGGKNKTLMEHEECAENLFLALGQKADKKALPVLTKNLRITRKTDRPTRARIAALGRIRDEDSVEALIDIMNSGAARRKHPNMREITLSLQVLTGEEIDQRDDWQRWWNNNKKSFKIQPEEGKATSRKARATWKIMWALPEDAELMKEALKRGYDDFADADGDALEKMREKAERQKKKEEEAARRKEEKKKEKEKDDGVFPLLHSD